MSKVKTIHGVKNYGKEMGKKRGGKKLRHTAASPEKPAKERSVHIFSPVINSPFLEGVQNALMSLLLRDIYEVFPKTFTKA